MRVCDLITILKEVDPLAVVIVHFGDEKLRIVGVTTIGIESGHLYATLVTEGTDASS